MTPENTDAAAFTGLSNREMAAIFFNIASVLREQGNVNPWRTEAYERGARTLMGYPTEAREVLSSHKIVPFRRERHMGKRLQAKIREMATSGALEQYKTLIDAMPQHRRELMTLPGIGPRMADYVHVTLGIATAAELVRAARDGRLRTIKGFGPQRTAAIAAVNLPCTEAPHLFSNVE